MHEPRGVRLAFGLPTVRQPPFLSTLLTLGGVVSSVPDPFTSSWIGIWHIVLVHALACRRFASQIDIFDCGVLFVLGVRHNFLPRSIDLPTCLLLEPFLWLPGSIGTLVLTCPWPWPLSTCLP